MEGLAFGKVLENYDANHPGMLKIALSGWEKEDSQTFWAPVITPYGGKEYGMYFLPEVDDTVVIGFIGNDPQTPVVLGSFWNKANPHPPQQVTEKNENKAIRTKGGHQILFQDGENGGITVKTQKGHVLAISEKEKTLTLSTGDGKNTVVLNEEKSEISIKALEKIEIKAKDITVEGTALVKGPSIKLEAKNELALKGRTVKQDGTSTKISGQTMEIKSAGPLKMESSALLTLKGSMTKIN